MMNSTEMALQLDRVGRDFAQVMEQLTVLTIMKSELEAFLVEATDQDSELRQLTLYAGTALSAVQGTGRRFMDQLEVVANAYRAAAKA